MFDIDVLDTKTASEVPFKLEFKHPATKVGIGMGVYVIGKDSQAFRSWNASYSNELRRREFEARRKGKGAAEPLMAEQSEQKGIDLLVACTVGFWCDPVQADPAKNIDERVGGHGFFYQKGQRIDYSEDAARKLYANSPEAFRQADDAIGDIENFMKP